ncbi:MAG TPA: GAF and ANTAR domain-containing protein [Acidimicrobiales bacterium]|nr:GAF and ANTAR domain-containing protein [Acidimicrobiales bacterium]
MSDFEDLVRRVDALARGDAVVRAKLQAAADLLVRAIPVCDTASVGLVLNGTAMTAASVDHVALEVDLLQYRFEEGPCLDAVDHAGGQVVRVDLIDDHRYNRFAPGALDAGVTSVLSLPCSSSTGRVIGSLNLYSRGSGSFDRDSETRARPFVEYVAKTIEESPTFDLAVALVDGVTDQVEGEAVVNQAVGLIMERRRCSAESALAALGASAVARGQDLRTAAESILDGRALRDEG